MRKMGRRTIRHPITPMRTQAGSPRLRGARPAPAPTGGDPGPQKRVAPTVHARTMQMQADSRSSTRHIEDLPPPDRRHGSRATRLLRSPVSPSGSPSKHPHESARLRSDREARDPASSGMRQAPGSPRSDRSPGSAGRLRRATSVPNPKRIGLLGYDVVWAAADDDRNASPWARRSGTRSSATGGSPRGSRSAKAPRQRAGCGAPARSCEARRPEGAAEVDRPRRRRPSIRDPLPARPRPRDRPRSAATGAESASFPALHSRRRDLGSVCEASGRPRWGSGGWAAAEGRDRSRARVPFGRTGTRAAATRLRP